jgi:2-keto-4-pentenoate hydratase/2-oxohepta-3-ene-1,7-dioic acid hydratase in catechol pathway
MKLIRFGNPGEEKPGIETNDGKRWDVSAFGEDYNASFLDSDGINRLRDWWSVNQEKCPEIDPSTRLGPPTAIPSKLICVGLNYAAHAVESGLDIPGEPVIFAKAPSSVIGPNDNIVIPKGSVKTDWEVELAIVIGKKASYVSEKDALDYIAGYVLHNDVSEREFQIERGGQWLKGKSADTFAPLGPWLVTKDEIVDPNNLSLWLKVNGTVMQNSSTSDFIFGIEHVVSYISQFMSLWPGDIISTGTPEGVGLGLNPPHYLRPGDVIELGVEGLGTSRQKVVAYDG